MSSTHSASHHRLDLIPPLFWGCITTRAAGCLCTDGCPQGMLVKACPTLGRVKRDRGHNSRTQKWICCSLVPFRCYGLQGGTHPRAGALRDDGHCICTCFSSPDAAPWGFCMCVCYSCWHNACATTSAHCAAGCSVCKECKRSQCSSGCACSASRLADWPCVKVSMHASTSCACHCRLHET